MNENKARELGLSFTGLYSSDKKEFDKSFVKYKLAHPKARIVKVWTPTSKLSRGWCAGAGGWSAYADEKYFAYGIKAEAERVINDHDAVLERLKKEYDKQVVLQNEKFKTAKKKFEDAESVLATQKSQ